MEVKRNFISCILIIIVTIMAANDSVAKKGDDPGILSKAKDSIASILTMSPNTFLNWKTSSLARNFYKAVGFAPIVKEDKVDKLLKLIANEADLIKIGAFRKLNKLSDNASTEESKKKLILAKLQATIELVKYYGVSSNFLNVKFTFAQGMYYAQSCQKLFGDKSGECLKKKLNLFAAFMFSYKVEVNRVVRFLLNKTKKEAETQLPGDKLIKFIDTKITCEIKCSQEKKNVFLKTVMKIYTGSSKKDINCVTELLPFENDLHEIDSYPGEFHYLLARAYGHQKNYAKALEHLHKARRGNVVDSKTRETNKKVQAYYEKIYTLMNATGVSAK